MKEFRINDYLYLKLENNKTNLYLRDKLFLSCKYLLLNKNVDQIKKYDEIKSIDEAVELLDKSLEFSGMGNIPSEMEFWGHCSNLQAWYENSYNTCLIHRNLAFPLLKELTKAGDLLAKKVFKEEIAIRFESGYLNVVRYLLDNNYLGYLNKEELECVLDSGADNIITNITRELGSLWKDPLKNYGKIINLIELITTIALKYNKNYFFEIYENLPEGVKKEYAVKTILYLNYMEYKKSNASYESLFDFF